MLTGMTITTAWAPAAVVGSLLLGIAIGVLIGLPWGRLRGRQGAHLALEAQTKAHHAVVRSGLDSLHEQMRALQEQRVSWQAQLYQQVSDVRATTEGLRQETAALATALRRPHVRGRWGEMHLRRAVELAGLVARCDFDEQVTIRSDDAALRPDLVVHLAGGKQVVVDAKVPLDAFLDAIETEAADPAQATHLARHAGQFRAHIDALSAKAYWRRLSVSPEFVVLFVPGESFLAAALESDRDLIEYAAKRKVVLATPTTLIALLRTVAHAWTQESLADKAREIHRLGCDLYERIATLGGHLDKVGRSLTAAVGAYNQAVGSLESRVLVAARRFGDLDVTEAELPMPRVVETTPRSPTALELVEDERTGALGGSPAAQPSSANGVASDEPA